MTKKRQEPSTLSSLQEDLEKQYGPDGDGYWVMSPDACFTLGSQIWTLRHDHSPPEDNVRFIKRMKSRASKLLEDYERWNPIVSLPEVFIQRIGTERGISKHRLRQVEEYHKAWSDGQSFVTELKRIVSLKPERDWNKTNLNMQDLNNELAAAWTLLRPDVRVRATGKPLTKMSACKALCQIINSLELRFHRGEKTGDLITLNEKGLAKRLERNYPREWKKM